MPYRILLIVLGYSPLGLSENGLTRFHKGTGYPAPSRTSSDRATDIVQVVLNSLPRQHVTVSTDVDLLLLHCITFLNIHVKLNTVFSLLFRCKGPHQLATRDSILKITITRTWMTTDSNELTTRTIQVTKETGNTQLGFLSTRPTEDDQHSKLITPL